MASLATPTVFETLGPTDTKTALADALTLRYESPSDSAPKPRIASTAPKPRAPAATAPAEEEKLAEEKKPGFLGRLIGMGPSEAKDEPKDDAEKKTKAEPPAEKPKDSKTEVATEPAADEKKPGFLGRMFGANGDDEKPKEPKAEEPKVEAKAPEVAKTEPKEKEKPKAEPEKKAATPKPEAAPESKPKTKAEEKPAAGQEPSEPKKRGFLGRMFGGGDSKSDKAAEPEKADAGKEKKKKADEKPADDQSSALPTGLLDVTALFDARTSPPSPGPVLVQQPVWSLEGIWSAFFSSGTALWEAWAPESGRSVILGFGKKKKPEEGDPEEEKPKADEKKKEEPKPKPSKKKEEKKEPEKEADKAKKEDPKPEPPAKAAPPPAPKPTATASKPRLVPVSVPIEQYTVILKRKDRDAILDRSAKALAALAQRANVLFRPLINDYIAVIADLQVDKTKDMPARLSALKAKTEEIYARAKAVEDHLDWFEASETQNYSGTFEDYLRLPEQIKKELPPREDPIAKYLDEVEAQGVK
jgi:outer membrane biosynthesis protein TonB